ncbi:hypothetical protein OIU74_024625 [Salix koriyanagi]|uniref:Uncharacterized protein n=1 Tax=Salix koriyanagi TaxID=2511006 RepID=A0A9Q0W7I9_9ROSI|nr:hypothetical protein OIU74_024625 [Salix koriyanagi]
MHGEEKKMHLPMCGKPQVVCNPWAGTCEITTPAQLSWWIFESTPAKTRASMMTCRVCRVSLPALARRQQFKSCVSTAKIMQCKDPWPEYSSLFRCKYCAFVLGM